jgi:hypothetical protein
LCSEKSNVPEHIDVMVASTQRSIEATIKDRRAGFDLIIIDAPGVDSSLQTTIIRSSELVGSPIQPAIKELEAAGQAVAAVNEANDQFGLKIAHFNVRTRISVPGRNLEAYRYIRPFVASLVAALLWQWARRRHPDKPRRWVKGRCLVREGTRDWVFRAAVKNDAGNITFCRLLHASDVPSRRHCKILAEANPFDPMWDN